LRKLNDGWDRHIAARVDGYDTAQASLACRFRGDGVVIK